MRMDKLTSKFQMALAEAQSLAVGLDHQFIEPAHVMVALLDQQGALQGARPGGQGGLDPGHVLLPEAVDLVRGVLPQEAEQLRDGVDGGPGVEGHLLPNGQLQPAPHSATKTITNRTLDESQNMHF